MTEQGKVLDINGLTTEEVKERQEKYGKNQLIPEKRKIIFFLKYVYISLSRENWERTSVKFRRK